MPLHLSYIPPLSMVNVDFSNPSLVLGIGLIGCGVVLLQVGLMCVYSPLLLLVMATPVIVLLCLLLVAVFMTPAMVEMVGQRRFPAMERKHGGSMLVSVLWSLG